jgi:hypothetical protein
VGRDLSEAVARAPRTEVHGIFERHVAIKWVPRALEAAGAGHVVERLPEEPFTHPADPSFDTHVRAAAERRALEQEIVESLRQLREAIGLTQADLGRAWGPQAQVSRLERDPARVVLATLVGYVQALGGELVVEAKVEGRTYRYRVA